VFESYQNTDLFFVQICIFPKALKPPWGSPNFLFEWMPEALLQGVNRPEREDDHSPSIEFENAWSNATISSTRLYVADRAQLCHYNQRTTQTNKIHNTVAIYFILQYHIEHSYMFRPQGIIIRESIQI
jgi:hypothetical protein